MMVKLLPIIPAVYCPWTHQHHSVAACQQLCDYCGVVESKRLYCRYDVHPLLILATVMCPCINRLMGVGSCADQCNCYKGDGVDLNDMKCSYGDE